MWKMSFHKHGLWGNITTLCRSVHVPAFWLCGSRHRQYISLKMFLKVEGIWREDGCVWNEVGGKVVKRTGVTAHPCGWNSAMVKYKYTVYMELTSSEAGLCCVFNLHLCVSLMKNIYMKYSSRNIVIEYTSKYPIEAWLHLTGPDSSALSDVGRGNIDEAFLPSVSSVNISVVSPSLLSYQNSPEVPHFKHCPTSTTGFSLFPSTVVLLCVSCCPSPGCLHHCNIDVLLVLTDRGLPERTTSKDKLWLCVQWN